METIGFSAVDVFIVIVVVLSLIIGWARGATKEILSVVAWIGGIYLTISSFPFAQNFTKNYISHGLIANFVTACVLFILFLTILSIINYFCSNMVKKSMLNITDKALGGIFGIVRAIVILVVIDLIINQCILTETPKWLEDSKFRPTINSMSNFIILIMPKDLQDKLLSHMSQIKKQSLLNFVKDGLIENISPDSINDIIEETLDNKVTATDANKITAKDDLDDEFVESKEVNETGQSAKDLATLKPKRSTNNGKEQNKPPMGNQRNDMDRILDQL